MNDWRSVLHNDPINWLLEPENPSVRYLALTQLLDMPESDAEVASARSSIMQRGTVPEMLALQATEAYQKTFPRFYTAKYTGLVWSLIVLAEHRASLNAQIAAQCEYLLTNAQESTEGGFAMNTSAKTGGGRITEVIPCLTGNMVWCMVTLGYGDDPRVAKGVDWLVNHMRYNDGIALDPQTPPYDRYEMCWGAHTCHMGVVKALKAYSVIPQPQRTPEVQAAIVKAAEFMLAHHVDRRSHNLNRISKPGWRRLGFPLMYQTDTLEVLDVLTALGYRDPRMADAVQAMVDKQDADGRWRLENTYANDRILLPMGSKGEPNKWLTLRALRVLKRYL